MKIPAELACCYCGNWGTPAETAEVACNVRRFADRTFTVWRCAGCASIHALDDLDERALAAYYAEYPIHEIPLDWRTRPMFDQQRWRLVRSGLRRAHRILDYGCGSGTLVRFLRSKGFVAEGWDAYVPEFADRAVLDATYDCVITQDVLEHVADPRAMLAELAGLAQPGGLVAIGTPDAAGIRLGRASRYRHPLHQPYHRHVASQDALEALAEGHSWQLVRRYRSAYSNTSLPFINARFVELLMRLRDDTVDAAMEPPSPWILPLLPWALLLGLFGAPFARRTEMMLHFRTPA